MSELTEQGYVEAAAKVLESLDDDQYECMLNAVTIAWVMGHLGVPHAHTVPSTLMDMGARFEAYWQGLDSQKRDYARDCIEWYQAQQVAERMG